MSTLSKLIGDHRFTQGLNPRYLHLLVESAALEHFGAQQVIFREGDYADRCYLIHTGLVALQTFVPGHGVTTVQTLGAGEVLGWSWIVAPYRWHFSALAVEPVEAVGLCASTLTDRMEENHDFGYEILLRMVPVMLERLQSTRIRLLESYGMPA